MKLLFIGNLGSVSLKLCKALRSAQLLSPDLLITESEIRQLSVGHPLYEDSNTGDYKWIIWPGIKGVSQYHGVMKIVQVLRTYVYYKRHFCRYDVIIASTMNSIWAYLCGSKYFAMTTGADITELAFERSIRGRLYRRSLVRAEGVLLLNINQFAYAERLGLTKICYLPFAIDSSLYRPQGTDEGDNRKGLRILHSCRLDWVDTSRTSIKRNDIFFKGFSAFIKSQPRDVRSSIELVVFKFGTPENIAATVDLIEDLGFTDIVSYLDPCSKSELIGHYSWADIVIDQFHLGAFGLNFLEAMACESVVMANINKELLLKCYDEEPPILNCKNEMDIEESLCRLVEMFRSDLEVLKKKSRHWVKAFHESELVADRFKKIITEKEYMPYDEREEK